MYHYERYTTITTTYDDSSVAVRELDDGEVGILMAGNNSIFDPSLTPRMLSVPTPDYDVESSSPHMDDDDDDDDDDWFPSLRHLSWIHGLDDDDDVMVDRMMETLFASAVIEQDENDQSQSRTPESKKNQDELDDDCKQVDLVPIDIIYIRFTE
ncbi:hypothetical protein BC941DRAFT_434972 [Chlamydoabsidia padenii]|nr:hypothetical protein BC941DRAFT_434972 [Chlamydoabsidia padenii]